jgi:hypothetical protein
MNVLRNNFYFELNFNKSVFIVYSLILVNLIIHTVTDNFEKNHLRFYLLVILFDVHFDWKYSPLCTIA